MTQISVRFREAICMISAVQIKEYAIQKFYATFGKMKICMISGIYVPPTTAKE